MANTNNAIQIALLTGRGEEIEKVLASQEELDALKQTKADAAMVPTISELTAQTMVPVTISANSSYPVFIAPFPCKVAYAALMNWGNGIAADDTNSWTITLRRLRAGATATIATKTTKATGGQAVALRTEWSFDAIVLDANNKVLQKGDAVDFQFGITGAPANWNNVIMAIRYEPI